MLKVSTANTKVIHWTWSIWFHPPAILRTHLNIEHNVILPSLADLPNKGFPTDFLSPDHYINKTISFLKTEAVRSIATAMTASNLTLLMPVITSSVPSVRAGSPHARWPHKSSTQLSTQQFARRVSELLQWSRYGCSQAVWQLERQRTIAVQWDTLGIWCARFIYILTYLLHGAESFLRS